MSPATIKRIVLPGMGLAIVLVVWAVLSQTVAHDLPSPARTWAESRRYVLEPFFKDGEMNQGIGRIYPMTPGPNAVLGAPIEVALPRPRSRRHMSLTPAYQKARQALVEFLKAARAS